MKKIFFVLLAIVIVVLAVALGHKKPQANTASLPKYSTTSAKIGAENFTLLVTRSAKERQLGLGEVKILPKNYGMLFEGSGQINIWMKGMGYPIDIIWLDKTGKVVHIERNAQPSSYPDVVFSNPEQTNAKYVVELNANESKRLDLKNGEYIKLQKAY